MMNNEQFSLIKKKFENLDRERLKQGKLPYEYTSKGVWAGASCKAVFDFFKEIGLNKYKSFIDLGSGDGRVTMIASVFTNATGVELDSQLIKTALSTKKTLNLKAEFLKQDILETNLSGFDIVFINPDKGFHEGTEKKLVEELKGTLYVYNNLYLPRFLTQGSVHVFEDIPFVEYVNKI
jgi:16S rRNA G966 N2-methylase RsmD